jgi:hypothetical protein
LAKVFPFRKYKTVAFLTNLRIFPSDSFLLTHLSNFANMGKILSVPTDPGLSINPGNSSIPTPSKFIEWGSCPGNYTPPFSCAKFLVPLDYSDKSSIDLLKLSLIKLNATKPPRRGAFSSIQVGLEVAAWD